MRLTIWRVISVLLVVWIVFAGAAHFIVFRELRQVIQLIRLGEIELVEVRANRAGEWLRVARFSSLGMSRVKPLSPIYNLGDDLVVTLKSGSEIYELSAEMLTKSLSGIELSGQEIEEWQLGMSDLLVQQTNLMNSVVEFGEGAVGKRLVGVEVLREVELVRRLVDENRELVDAMVEELPDLIGMERRRLYAVLLQNNMELRPTGGFMGSYALVEFSRGAMVNLEIQDIYEPDGRIAGYVEEPMPIREYLFDGEHPGWRLRDSNWDPHFPRATDEIGWFFAEGGLDEFDGMGSITMWPVKDLLKLTGSIPMPDYGIEVDYENMYQHAQYFAEHEFFPGSTQKRDFLGAMGRKLLWEVIENHGDYLRELGPLLLKHLNENQIQFYLFDHSPTESMTDVDESRLANELSRRGWDGGQMEVRCRIADDCAPDYLMLVEANVGINKANCCVEREVVHEIVLVSDGVRHMLEILYVNNNPPVPLPPDEWGGGYKNYIRLYVPLGSELLMVRHDGVEVDNELITVEQVRDKQVIGWMSLVPGGREQMVEVEYVVPFDLFSGVYELVMQKQSGIDELDWNVEIDDSLGRSEMLDPYTFVSLNQGLMRRDVLFVVR